MSFLAPMMLWGSVAAAIPIALHFFFRSRYRTVPWAAMKFLLTSIEQTSRRLRFQELLLLCCRVLILTVLALALARPLSSVVRGAGRGDAVDAVLVFNVSMSMGASDGATSRLERAKAAALNIIGQLPSHSTVQVITCADRAEVVGPRSPGDLPRAVALIEDLQLTSLATNLYPGVAEARGVLQRGQSSNKELYILSDMQKLGWEEQTGDLKRALEEISEKTTVFMVRCGTRTPANVAIVGITPQVDVPRPGERIGFAVLVRNTSSTPLQDLKVSLTIDNNDKLTETQALSRIDPEETRSIPLTGKLEKAGLRLLTARVSHDDLEGDNRFDQVLYVREQVNILVVDGGLPDRDPRKSSVFYLLNALLPIKETEQNKYVLQPKIVTPRLAAPALLAKTDLVLLVNVALAPDSKSRAEALPPDFVDELDRFVRLGKSLIIFAGDNVAATPYNKLLGETHGLLPMAIKGRLQVPYKEALKMNPSSAGLAEFWRFRDDKFLQNFKEIEVYQALDLSEEAAALAKERDNGMKEKAKADPVTVVFRYDNGKPAVVERTVDAGKVVLFASSADLGYKSESAEPAWTNWPIHPTYAPFLNVTINYLLHGQTQVHNVVAGQPLEWRPTEKELRSYTLVHPDGRNERLGLPEKDDKRPVVRASNLDRAGIYRMIASVPNQGEKAEANLPETQRQEVPIAVVPDPRESEDLGSLTDEQIDRLVGFKPIHVTAGAEAPLSSVGDRLNREWTTWLLVIVLFLALGESLLATWCGRAW